MKRLALLGLLALSCSDKSELAPIVDRHCAAVAARIPSTDGSHDGDLSTDLFTEFMFCRETRDGDRATLDKLSADFQVASQKMAEGDAATRARARATMVELFSQLNRYPIKR